MVEEPDGVQGMQGRRGEATSREPQEFNIEGSITRSLKNEGGPGTNLDNFARGVTKSRPRTPGVGHTQAHERAEVDPPGPQGQRGRMRPQRPRERRKAKGDRRTSEEPQGQLEEAGHAHEAQRQFQNIH